MKRTGNPNRRGGLKLFSAASAVVVGLVSVNRAHASAPVLDALSSWAELTSDTPLPSDFGLYYNVPNPNPVHKNADGTYQTNQLRPPDSNIAGTAVGATYLLPTGTTSLTGMDFNFANATGATFFNRATVNGVANYTYPQYNGGAGITFNAIKITVSIYTGVTPTTPDATYGTANASGLYVGLNTTTPAFTNLISTQTITDTVDSTPFSGYSYIYDAYAGKFPTINFTPVNVTGISEIGVTYDIQGSTDGGATYAHYAGLDPIVLQDDPLTAGALAQNNFYLNSAGETNGNFTEGPHYYTTPTSYNVSGVVHTGYPYTTNNNSTPSVRLYGIAPGTTYNYISATDDTYTDDTQWNPDGVPGGNDTAVFNNGSTTGYTVESPDLETASILAIQNDTVSFDIDAETSGFLVQTSLVVGQPAVAGGTAVGNFTIVNSGLTTLNLFETVAATVGANGGTGTLTVTNGVVLYVDNDLAINKNSKVVVSTFGELNVGTLTFAGTTNAWQGQLDIGNSAVVLRNASIGTVINQLKTGLNKGTWTGQGIVSSIAAADTYHLTAIGAIVNNNGSGGKIYGSGTTLGLFVGDDIDNGDPDLNAILLRYTYFGDTNLDGTVNLTDYSRIDSGFLTHATGWYNGDFNYDGVINGADYTLIDNSFNREDEDPLVVGFGDDLTAAQRLGVSSHLAANQGGLETGPAYAAEGTSEQPHANLTAQLAVVPEPATLGLLALGAIPMLGRRSRRLTGK